MPMTAMTMQPVQITTEATCAPASLAIPAMAKIVQTWMSAPRILTIATPTQLAKTLLDHLNARVTQASLAMESSVLTSMNAPQILITVTPMQHAETRMVPLIAPAIQDSLARD